MLSRRIVVASFVVASIATGAVSTACASLPASGPPESKAAAPGKPTPPPADPPKTAAMRIADDIDTGPVGALSERFPASHRVWLDSLIETVTEEAVPGALKETLAELQTALAVFAEPEGGNIPWFLDTVPIAARALALNDKVITDSAAYTQNTYLVADVDATLLGILTLLQSSIGLVAYKALEKKMQGESFSTTERNDLATLYAHLPRLKAALLKRQRHSTALLLRSKDLKTSTQGLRLLLDVDEEQGECARRVLILTTIRFSNVASFSPDDGIALAKAHYAELDLPKGRALRRSLIEESGDKDPSVVELFAIEKRAEQIVKLGGADRLADHGRLLLDTDCQVLAKLKFTELIRDAPNDARGPLGLVWTHGQLEADMPAMIEILRGALHGTNKDGPFYETAVGLHGADLFSIIHQAMLGATGTDNAKRFSAHRESIAPFLKGFRQTAPAKADLLSLVYDTAHAFMTAKQAGQSLEFSTLLRDVLPRLRELRKNFPASLDVARTHILAATIVASAALPGEKPTFAADLETPLPAAADESLRMSQFWAHVSVLGPGNKQVTRMTHASAQQPERKHLNSILSAMSRAADAENVSDAPWSELSQHLASRESAFDVDAQANNRFVADWLAADIQVAEAGYRRTYKNAEIPNVPIVALNLVAAQATLETRGLGQSSPTEQTFEILDYLFQKEELEFAHPEILLWKAYLLTEMGKQREAKIAACASIEAEGKRSRKSIRTREIALLTPGTFNIQFGLHSYSRFNLTFGIDMEPWFVLMPPTDVSKTLGKCDAGN